MHKFTSSSCLYVCQRKTSNICKDIHRDNNSCYSFIYISVSIVIEEESLEKNVMKVNRQSLFMEKPLSAFDVNFELLHSGVASLPGIIDLYVHIIHQLYFIAAIYKDDAL